MNSKFLAVCLILIAVICATVKCDKQANKEKVNLEEEKLDFIPNFEFENSATLDKDEDSKDIEEDINALLKESGLTDKDIAYIYEMSNKKWEDLGSDEKLAQEAISDVNELINEVNNYTQLKSNDQEAELLDDSLTTVLEDETENNQTQNKNDEPKELSQEQKDMINDLEDELDGIDSENYDFIDL